MRQKRHAKTLKAREDRLKAEAKDKASAGVRQEQRRAERKVARENRARENAKAQMRDEIRKLLIDKGSVMGPVSSHELMDIHGNYEKGGK
jgi:hypothetical protein